MLGEKTTPEFTEAFCIDWVGDTWPRQEVDAFVADNRRLYDECRATYILDEYDEPHQIKIISVPNLVVGGLHHWCIVLLLTGAGACIWKIAGGLEEYPPGYDRAKFQEMLFPNHSKIPVDHL